MLLASSFDLCCVQEVDHCLLVSGDIAIVFETECMT